MERNEGEELLQSRFTRRDALRLGGLGAVSAFGLLLGSSRESRKPLRSEPTSESNLSAETIWTDDEIANLAQGMVDFGYLNTAYCGNIILDSLAGRPSFSKMSPIFEDSKIGVVTVNKPRRGEKDIPLAAATISHVLPYETTKLAPRVPGAEFSFLAPQGFRFDRMEFSKEFLESSSPNVRNLIAAKEIMNVTAFEMASLFLANMGMYGDFKMPEDEDTRNRVQAASLGGEINGVPGAEMADLWAHFLIIPDVLKAKENGDLTLQEIDGDVLRLFFGTATLFKESGILFKDQDGEYQWTANSDDFYGSWSAAGEILYETVVRPGR